MFLFDTVCVKFARTKLGRLHLFNFPLPFNTLVVHSGKVTGDKLLLLSNPETLLYDV